MSQTKELVITLAVSANGPNFDHSTGFIFTVNGEHVAYYANPERVLTVVEQRLRLLSGHAPDGRLLSLGAGAAGT